MIRFILTCSSMLLLAACATTPQTSSIARDHADTLGFDPEGSLIDGRQLMMVRTNASFYEIDFRKSIRADDVGCKEPTVYSGFRVNPKKPYRNYLDLSRNLNLIRSLFEWHFCFIIDGVTYPAWRGFDPGPHTDLEIMCFIDQRQIARKDTSKYLCRTTHVTQNFRNHTEYSKYCWAENQCKRFDTADDFKRWQSLNPLNRDELFEIAAAVLDYSFSSDTDDPDDLVNYYVSIAGHDLPQELLAKYASEKVVFHPFREFEIDAGSNFQIGMSQFEQVEAGLAIGTYSTFCGNLCASSNTVIVEKKNGKWRVKSFELGWIS